MFSWSIIAPAAETARATLLAGALMTTAPQYLNAEDAKVHAYAAIKASTENISPELLLGMAYVESNYKPRATSRVSKGKRKTGIPKWNSPPSYVRGPYFCGVVQAAAGKSWKKCLKLRDIEQGYIAGAKELEEWRVFCKKIKSRNIEKCILAGHGHGRKKAKSLKTSYPSRVLKRRNAIEKAKNL